MQYVEGTNHLRLKPDAIAGLRELRRAAEHYFMSDNEGAAPRVPEKGDLACASRRGIANPATCDGTFIGQRAFTVSISIDGACPFEPGDDVLIAAGPVGERLAALARFNHGKDGTAVFNRLSPWRPVDSREHPRFRTQMRANVRRKAGNIHGTVLDVSRGGIALAVDEAPGLAHFDVRVGTTHGSPYLPCRLVSQRERDGQLVLHIRFGELDAMSAAYVDRLVGSLCEAMEPALLAS